MKLKKLSAVAATATLALTLAACGSSGGATPTATSSEPAAGGSSEPAAGAFEAGTTMAKLANAGKIRVGTKFDQPGFGLKGLGDTPEGFDVEIAKIIAKGLGIGPDGIEYTEAPSKLREQLITDGKVDIVAATYTINDKRKELIGFAGPYYEAGQDLMVKKDNDTIKGPDDLKAAGSKVCSVTGSTPAETIKKYTDNIILFDVYSKCADALRTGQVDVVTTDNVILLGLVADSKDAFKLVGNPFTKEPYGIGYAKGDTKFCQFIDDTLKKASEDGDYEKAWTSTAGKFSPKVPKLPTLAPCA